VCVKVKVRISLDFIRLPNNCRIPLIQGPAAAIMICVPHHLGDPWELVREALNFASLLF
jgi:hypothetical protein